MVMTGVQWLGGPRCWLEKRQRGLLLPSKVTTNAQWLGGRDCQLENVIAELEWKI